MLAVTLPVVAVIESRTVTVPFVLVSVTLSAAVKDSYDVISPFSVVMEMLASTLSAVSVFCAVNPPIEVTVTSPSIV